MSQQRVRFSTVVVSLLVALAFVLAGPGRADDPASCPQNDATLITVNGQPALCGTSVAGGKVYAYLGIPYAQPPVKALRWKPPQAAPWPPATAVQRITYGNECVQSTDAGKEDCLYLNVWAPKGAINGAKKLPVMVYIHGGAFLVGSGASPIFAGGPLASTGAGAVMVTLNYRLGALGFLVANSHGSGPIDGNLGLLDQQLAMTWVHDNIARFGGDPASITLFGESAGAMSVGLHTFVVPSSQQLFGAAVMQSNPLGVQYLRHDDQSGDPALKQGNDFLDELCRQYNKWRVPYVTPKCPDDNSDGSWLQHVSPARIIIVQDFYSGSSSSPFSPSLPWAPVVDGMLVKAQPYFGYASGMPRKSLGFGVNADEGVLFAAIDYHGDKAWFDDPKNYGDALTNLFGEATKQKILEIARYDPGKQKDPTGSYYNKVGVAMANLITDYVFACGNVAAANAAAAAGSAPVYGYQFTQAPFFDLYYESKKVQVDNGACEPSTHHVCHGNEMPYVFGNLGAVTRTSPTFTPTAGDKSLAAKMTAAWAAFAAKPAAPSSGWIRYAPATGNKLVKEWTGDASTPIDLDAAANCSSLWLHTPPYAVRLEPGTE